MQRDRILRETEVRRVTGLSRTTRWRLACSGKFPKPVNLTDHAVGWKESEIQLWIERRQCIEAVEVRAGEGDTNPSSLVERVMPLEKRQ